jgi:hypothetical protein
VGPGCGTAGTAKGESASEYAGGGVGGFDCDCVGMMPSVYIYPAV